MIQTHSEIEQHLETCDSVFRVLLEENRLLKVEKCVPGPRLTEKKRVLMARLDDGLAQLHVWDPHTYSPEEEPLLERLRSRILQILNLDRENEQLLFKQSPSRPMARPQLPAPSPRQLRDLYRI